MNNNFLFVLSAILITSVGMASAFGQTESLMTVTTDKTFYFQGDTILITGEVENRYSGVPVTVMVTSPNGNIVGVDQITVNAENKFNTEIIADGSLMSTGGTYTILVHYGTVQRSTTFDLESLSTVIKDEFVVADATDKISYEITGGELLDIKPDVESSSLIVSIDASNDGVITLSIPRTIFDSVKNGVDSEVFVFVDNDEINFDETSTPTERTITISFPEGTTQIEIIGTFVVPEFGTIAAMILAVAIISIIAVSSKSRLNIMPRY